MAAAHDELAAAAGAKAPLAGVRVVELAGIGPAPFGVQLLADFGADVVRVDRPGAEEDDPTLTARYRALSRGRRSVVLDLKSPRDLDSYRRLAATADVVVDPYRPGVTDRLGVGPASLRETDPRLVYVQMTGWGADGPMAQRAGHDINYLAMTGVLYGIGSADRPPPPPINYLGDFAGGSLFLVIGVLLALRERERTGEGQVVDVAMVDGVASLSTYLQGLRQAGLWREQRQSNLLDGGAHFYGCYRTADDRHVAVGALEPMFYAELLERLELAPADWPQGDRSRWPELRDRMAAIFLTRTRDEWEAVFAGSDACVSPVRTLAEAARDEHLLARGTYSAPDGLPAVAPRLSGFVVRSHGAPPEPGEHTAEVLAELVTVGEPRGRRKQGAMSDG